MPLKNVELFFDENPNPMFIHDLENLKIMDVNSAALDLYGYSRQEMVNLTIKDLNPPEDIQEMLNWFRKEFKSNKIGEIRHMTKNREILYVDIFVQPISVNGKNCAMVVVKDVTDKIIAEKKYNEGQEIINLLAEQLQGAFFLIDKDARLSRWNKYLEVISEYSSEEIASMNGLEFFSQESRPLILTTIQNVLKDGYSEIQSEIISKSGLKIPLYFKGNKIRINGEDHIIGIGLDISSLMNAQKEAITHQKLLEAIVDQSPSIIYIKDKQGRYQFANHKFETTFKLSKDEIIGKTYDDIQENKKEVAQISEIDQFVKEKRISVQHEEQVTVNGQEKTFLSNRELLLGIDKYEGYMLGVSTDITDSKALELLLRESLEEKETLLSEIHHRVKNNLAVISGLMDLQVMESRNHELKQKLMENQARISSMALTHEVLYQEHNFSKINLEKTLKRLVQSASQIYNSDVKFNLRTVPIMLNINQALPVSLIVNEILTNAFKHAFQNVKNPEMEIAIHEKEENVYLFVRDNGRGMPDNFNLNKSESLGFQLINTLKNQLKADLEIHSNDGVNFKLWFKKADIKGSGSYLVS